MAGCATNGSEPSVRLFASWSFRPWDWCKLILAITNRFGLENEITRTCLANLEGLVQKSPGPRPPAIWLACVRPCNNAWPCDSGGPCNSVWPRHWSRRRLGAWPCDSPCAGGRACPCENTRAGERVWPCNNTHAGERVRPCNSAGAGDRTQPLTVFCAECQRCIARVDRSISESGTTDAVLLVTHANRHGAGGE
jgi:hypothetical protein